MIESKRKKMLDYKNILNIHTKNYRTRIFTQAMFSLKTGFYPKIKILTRHIHVHETKGQNKRYFKIILIILKGLIVKRNLYWNPAY